MKKDPSIPCLRCGCYYLKSYLDMYNDGMCRSCGVKTQKEKESNLTYSTPALRNVEYLGEARKGLKEGEILGSFNAG